MKWDGERSEGTNDRADAFSHASEQQCKHRGRILHCVAMPFGSKKGEKKGEPKGIRVSAVATTRKVIMATDAELRDCTMGSDGMVEWSEMKHELATLGSR